MGAGDGNLAQMAIVGAGISGLATAIAIHQAAPTRFSGPVTIYEQAPGPREVGAGLQLGPNSVKTLAALGITALGASGACTPLGLRIMDGRTGNKIAQSPLGDWIRARHGAPYYTMARADLLTVLTERATALGIDIKYSTPLEALHSKEGGYELTLGGVKNTNISALIGADGLWSQVRRKLRPDNSPRYTGQTAWRALLPDHAVPENLSRDHVTLWLAPNLHAVHYPVENGHFALFTQGSTKATGWDIAGDKTELAGHINALDFDLAPALEALVHKAENFIKWPLFELMPSIAWGTGPATLVGDAAHPMLPYLAQGAAMGLEDGFVLANKIAEMPDVDRAFRSYERARARRVMRVQRAARNNARNFHFSGPAALARNAILRLGEGMSSGALMRRYDWLYGKGPAP